jgi:uncharacterized integral membrane protein (TIGR00697 family)
VSLRAQNALPIIALMFGALYILSNILAVKSITIPLVDDSVLAGPVQIWPLVLDGGFILFPLTYILDDILSEIYGFKTARKVILTGLGMQIFAVGAICVVGQISATPEAPVTDEVYSIVLGYVPRIVIASLAAYLVGELLNAWTLIKIRQRTGERKLWVRLIGSTAIGEAVDTITFCTIAFFGTISFPEFLNYTIVGYIVKCSIEVVMLPVTYRVIRWLKDGQNNGTSDNTATIDGGANNNAE